MEANQKLWPILQPTSFSVSLLFLLCVLELCGCGCWCWCGRFFAVDIIITQNSWNTISTISFTSLIFVNDTSCSLFVQHSYNIYNCDLLKWKKQVPDFGHFHPKKRLLSKAVHVARNNSYARRFRWISTEYLGVLPFEVWSTFNIHVIFICEYVRFSFHLLLFVMMICFYTFWCKFWNNSEWNVVKREKKQAPGTCHCACVFVCANIIS